MTTLSEFNDKIESILKAQEPPFYGDPPRYQQLRMLAQEIINICWQPAYKSEACELAGRALIESDRLTPKGVKGT